MPSIIQGYEYDIFISYRQKDNKHDGWVTDFVHNLKGELEATFKEDISVYFDINPHDGLLETHDVDASLKEKLKCLVLIPIISRTYCDPKSFAWEHEFKSFVELASQDQFGLKVKLPGGNVAGRILPVQIHEIDADDRKLVENELGGFLRGIEFIYREPGVNRPLMADEDHPDNNLNKTFYRNQINKVANAIKEIITGFKNPDNHGKIISERIENRKPQTGKFLNRKIISASLFVLIIILAGYFTVPKLITTKEQPEKSIAVLPFFNDSHDQENTHFINGIMDEVLNNLQSIKDLRVVSRTSVEQYRGTSNPAIPEIAKRLDVNYIVEGRGQKYGNTIRLRVQLIDANHDRHLWAKSYENEVKETKDIFLMQSQIAQSIAGELKAIITPEEKVLIEKSHTASLTAYDFYHRGRDELTNYEIDPYNKAALDKAEDLFHKALLYDSAFAQSYAGLAKVYWKKHSSVSEYFSENYLDSVRILCDLALSYDNKLAEAYTVRGDYYAEKQSLNKAIDEYDKALIINPNDWEAYYGKGETYFDDDLLESIKNFQKAASINHGKELPIILRRVALEYCSAGFINKVYDYNLEALKLDGDSASYLSSLSVGEKYQNNVEKALEYLQKAYSRDTTQINTILLLGHCYMFLNKHKETLSSYKKYIEILGTLGTFSQGDLHRVGWAYSENGERKKAEYFFDKQLEYSKNLIHFRRQWGQKLYPYYDMAGVYAYLDEKEKAYDCLKLLNHRQRMPLWVVTFLKIDPLLNSIRSEPEYQRIVRDVEAKYQAEHERVEKWLKAQKML